MKNRISTWAILGLVTVAALFQGELSISAQTTAAAKEKREQQREGRKEVREATSVLRKIMSVPDKAIPRELLEKAEGIGVFPGVIKAGFIFGGRGGDGVVARRTPKGWSTPVFYNIGGGSFGAQIGAQKTDYIMLFMNEGSLQDLLDDKLEFEGNLSFAAGPVGRTIGAGTNLSAEAGILVYSRSKGLFAGATIGGAVLTADNSINEAFYGMNGGEVLKHPDSVNMANVSADLRRFSDTVRMYAK
ncbi:MAG TPA: lipid-binding SYLF domain-containing protein [Pyrinomonadaceae bacterium]